MATMTCEKIYQGLFKSWVCFNFAGYFANYIVSHLMMLLKNKRPQITDVEEAIETSTHSSRTSPTIPNVFQTNISMPHSETQKM